PGDLPLFVRISATDWVEGGWDVAQSVELARRMKALGVDLVDCSSGHIVPGSQGQPAPGYQVPLAEQIRREAQVATAAVALITGWCQAEDILQRGQARRGLLARELLRAPYWRWRAAADLEEPPQWPGQHLRAAS